jgi:nucleotide-binding universal stress UspA family protein
MTMPGAAVRTHETLPSMSEERIWPHPHVVVGVDGSDAAQRAFLWAVEYVHKAGGTVHAVVVWHHDPVPVGPGVLPPPSYDAEQAARTLLDDAVAALPEQPAYLRESLVQGAAAHVLIEQSRHADLLVVGSRGRGGFTGLLLGSVSMQCVHHAACPVVVVPREWGR